MKVQGVCVREGDLRSFIWKLEVLNQFGIYSSYYHFGDVAVSMIILPDFGHLAVPQSLYRLGFQSVSVKTDTVLLVSVLVLIFIQKYQTDNFSTVPIGISTAPIGFGIYRNLYIFLNFNLNIILQF
jgi:hypothetical protein